MRLILATNVFIPENRQRRQFDEKPLAELQASILSKGLMHPIVVRPGDQPDTFFLVAGERRYRAMRALQEADKTFLCNGQTIQPGYLPTTLLTDLSPLQYREAELEENIVRADLTWQEKSRTLAEFNALREDQATANNQPHTIRAVASEILGREAAGAQITSVAETLLVAKHLEDADVAGAKTQKEALKVIKKKAEAAHREVLSAAFDVAKSPHTLIEASIFDAIGKLPAATFDCLVCDPPYGVGADEFGEQATTLHNYKDTPELALDCAKLVAQQGYAKCKEAAHCYFFLDIRNFSQYSTIFLMAGWEVWPTPILWNKLGGMLPSPDFGPRRTYEAILYARKGKRKVLKIAPDILTYPMVRDKDHGAQKPVALYKDLLSRSCYPGQVVADFFCGSGTIFPAANALKLTALGVELLEHNCNIAKLRLNETEDETPTPEEKPAAPSLQETLSGLLPK